MDFLGDAAPAILAAVMGLVASLGGLWAEWRQSRGEKRALELELEEREFALEVAKNEITASGGSGNVGGGVTSNSIDVTQSKEVAGAPAHQTARGWLQEKGAIIALVGVLVTAIFGPVAGASAQRYFSPPVIDCIDHRSRALDLIDSHGTAWVPLDEDDPVERRCSVNEVVSRVMLEE